MSDDETRVDGEELQFDRVVPQTGAPAAPAAPAGVCSSCGQTVATEYYDINGRTFCGRCRDAVEAYAETPRGAAPLVAASLFGLGAAVAGAIIYYAVLALLHLEIGIVAILIGYMVG